MKQGSLTVDLLETVTSAAANRPHLHGSSDWYDSSLPVNDPGQIS